MKFTYLLVNFFTIIIPLVFSFHARIRFDKLFGCFLKANALASICFLAWDILFTKMGVWGFNERYTVGIAIYNLPVEEILFFTCIPFACVFTYHCLTGFFTISWKENTERLIILGFCAILLVAGLLHIGRLYTSVTFVSAAMLLLFLKFLTRERWLSALLSVYPILLIPFFIVNGILTGTGLEQPVVWYNNRENLGIRLFTIPVEDIIYGLEMVLANVFLFEHYKKRLSNSSRRSQEPA